MDIVSKFLDTFECRKYRAVAQLEGRYVMGIRENRRLNLARIEIMREAEDDGVERYTINGWDVIRDRRGPADEMRNNYFQLIERYDEQDYLGRTHFADSDDLENLQ